MERALCAVALRTSAHDQDNGDLKEEMILVCNALRNDLMHANEYLDCIAQSGHALAEAEMTA